MWTTIGTAETRIHGWIRTVLSALAVVLLLAAGASAQEYGNITGVKLSPNLRTLMIRSDAPLGKHYAYVIDEPHRLVVDFESSGLGSVPKKIKIAHPPVEEIRLGLTSSRARVVVDFGRYPVPSFQIHRKANRVAVVFGSEIATSAKRLKRVAQSAKRIKRVTHRKPRKSRKRKRKPHRIAHKVPIQDNNPHFSLRAAGITDDMLFVELVDRSDSKRRYRLVVDLDINQVRIGQVSVSDANGNVQCFKVTETTPGVQGPSRGDPRARAVGPARTGTKGVAAERRKHPIRVDRADRPDKILRSHSRKIPGIVQRHSGIRVHSRGPASGS